MSKVYVKFPRTGLGNMLLVWAKARIFAHLNGFDLVTSSWWGLRWGALLRRENKSRIYRNYFRESSIQERIRLESKIDIKNTRFDPPIEKQSLEHRADLYVFRKVIDDIDLFGSIRPYREFIKDEIYKMLHPSRRIELSKFKAPELALHIRRGDFLIGKQETSLEYFIKAIEFIREHCGEEFPVTIFSDASASELKEVLALPSVRLSEPASDIADILLMSQSSILVLSQSSTFSYWAAFLSDAIVIIPSGDWQEKIRDEGGGLKEMKWHFNDPALYPGLISALKKFRSNVGV